MPSSSIFGAHARSKPNDDYEHKYQRVMHRIFYTLSLCVLPLLVGATSIFDLLVRPDQQKAVQMTVEVPLDSILAKTRNEQDATISFLDANGQAQRWALTIGLRGKFRRQRCDSPPLKFNFSKKDLAAAGLDKFDKYKLVAPCFADPGAEALVLKEYLAYKAYNMLTPNSFRVQLLRVTFRDTEGKRPKRTTLAFLIENTKEMAARLGGEELENAIGQPAEAFAPEAEAIHALFQYLVSNGDYNLPLARNVKVVKMPDGKLVPVGYDFDFTGWVGAPYASPTSEIGQRSIYERIYLGYAHADRLMRRVADTFQAQRKNIIGLINHSALEDQDQERLWRFTTRFFTELARMTRADGTLLYDQLRGSTAVLIPPGAKAEAYRSTGR